MSWPTRDVYKRQEHVTRRGAHVHHNVGESGLFHFSQVFLDVVFAVGIALEIAGSIYPDIPRLLFRLRLVKW